MKQYDKKKRVIQSHFYNQIPTKSNITALAGNNLDLHINDILPNLTSRSKAYIYDLSLDVIAKFSYLQGLHPNINLINDNIINAKINRIIDVDLMATLNTIQGIVFYLFQEQYNKYKSISNDKWNTFMFTHCLRNNKINTNDFIRDMLVSNKNIVYKSETITYRDGAPMSTTQIQWKVAS